MYFELKNERLKVEKWDGKLLGFGGIHAAVPR